MAATQAPVRATSRWPEAGRGVMAAVAIAGLVAGVPWALGRFVGWPLPEAMPSWSDISTALGDSYIPDTFLTKALALVCWIVWIELVASLLVEAVAVVRGRRAGTVPLAGPLQRLAARLVAAVSLLAVLVLARPDHHVQAVTPLLPAPATAELASTVAPEPGTATADATATPTYVVERRDTLWGVAEAQLGDPLRWVEIWELNRGRPQPDGRVLTDPDRICPGWTLQLPVDAAMGAGGGPGWMEPASSSADGSEPMVPLDTGGADRTGTRLVSDRGAGARVEVMVPLESNPPPVSQAEPLLAAGEPGDENAPPDEQRDR